MRIARALGASFLVASVACVNTAEDLGGNLPTGLSRSVEGTPQRLWDRYVLRDIEGNRVPVLYVDSTGGRYRVLADTLYFALSSGAFREVSVIASQRGSDPEVVSTVVSAGAASFGRPGRDSVSFPSIIFGATTGGLSGATPISPFSPLLTLNKPRASYVMF